ncbi:MAG: phosphoenolpyruvate carboxylase, partial [Deltaproteobacteria bacterium]|nr:phosphoenolpyruvate carboxylase [Deltaproteobacteria bacterium]
MTLPAPKEDALVSLRRDVRELGAMLGEVIQSQGGTRLFERVEDVRRLSKSGREGETRALETLTAQLSALPSEEALQLARAFSHFLSLANIAEQHDRVRMSRQSHQDPELPAGRGSVEELMTTLLQEGITPERLFETVCALKMELVLTAHPTEITRRALLQKYLALDAALSENDRPDLPEEERVEIQARIRREIAAFWHTDEVMRQKPSPRQEAWGGLLIFEQSLWQALPQVLRGLDRQVFKHTGQRIPLGVAPFTVGSWMGGDRDGNPNVTAKVTREVCWLSRWISADLYAREVSELIRELSMHRGTPELQKAAGGSAEPYRVVLREVEAKLGQNRKHLEELLHQGRTDTPLGYRNTEELREPLMLCYRSLCDSGLKVLAEGRLLDVLRRLDAFGLALVRLDLRQEASRHTDALDAVTRHLGLGSYAEWEEPRRVAFLSGELAQRRPLVPRTLLRLPPEDPALSPAAREVLETFALLAEIPAESLGAYVISMAVVPSDVLAVTLLLREFGVDPAPRVVPLFETVAALDAAGPIMDQLLSLPCYRERLGGLQEVMIGYSDSTKEAGRLASAWGLF